MPEPLHTVLIGTSLDRESDAVARAGIELARLHGATAYLAHAYDRPVLYRGATAEERGRDAGWIAADRALESQAARVGLDTGPGGRQLLLRPGAPRRVLEELAGELAAGVVVLGHRHGLPMGPTLDRAVRCFGCPVLVVHERAPVPATQVLAALDLSPASVPVLRRGLEILRPPTAPPPSLELLHVLSSAGGERADRPEMRRGTSLARQALHRCLLGAEIGNETREKVLVGDPDHEIVAEATAWGAGVVLVGTHARTRRTRFLFGSVARGVLRWAPCAVLVVPPDLPPEPTDRLELAVASTARLLATAAGSSA